MTITPAIPELLHFADLTVELAQPLEMGQGRAGTRRIIPIIGGRVTGQITGRVLNLGADWQTVFEDGLADLDTRYAIETEDSAVIEIRNLGFRHAPPEILAALSRGEDVASEDYYMRTHARLESGDPRYAHVNRKLFVGSGARLASTVLIKLYELT